MDLANRALQLMELGSAMEKVMDWQKDERKELEPAKDAALVSGSDSVKETG